MALLAERLARIGTENAFKIGPSIAAVEAAGHRVIRCNLGEPDFAVPEHVRAEVIRQLERDNTHYSDPQGIASLRAAIARQLSETRGIAMTPERVVVFPGAKPPIGMAQEIYVDPGDEVIYPSPGFPIYESFTRYVGARPVPLHLEENEGFSFTGADLARLLGPRTKLVYLNFPSNPTGGVATAERLEDIARVIQRWAPDNVRVYSDEVYEHILFDGAQHRSIASVPGMERRTIIVSGVSKSYAWTGGRVGWAAFPTEAEAHAFRTLNINYYSCMPAYNQEGARVAIESPESARTIREMVESFQARRDEVVPALRAIPGLRCQEPRGAFYLFPNISGICEQLGAIAAHAALPAEARAASSPSTLFQRFLLQRYHVATLDRRSFGGLGTDGLHFLRLSIATGIEDLREAVRRIAAAARDRAGFQDFIAAGGGAA